MVWIKSKYELNNEIQNTSLCTIIQVSRFPNMPMIEFRYDSHRYFWEYENDDDCDSEFEWILSQLDYRINDGKTKDDFEIEELRTLKKYIERNISNRFD